MRWDIKWDIFINKISTNNFNNNYTQMLGNGLLITLRIAIFGFLIGLVIGTIIASVKVAPKNKLPIKILDKIFSAYTAFFRGTPMMVQLLLAYYVVLPMLGITGVNAEVVGLIIFGLNSGAYVSEIMRGGINSVDIGQMEAGRSLGLSYIQTMIRIVIPQAIKNILPTLGNELIMLVKETSVLSFITVIDVYKALQIIATANHNYEFVIPYLVLGIIYIILVLIITCFVRLVEKIFNKSNKNTTSLVKKRTFFGIKLGGNKS
ncbi:MAG: amino acid ABC transporter permease [Clostridia bacterium]|nr:amino acid ABC transporter permease [Clostridia bacterium]